MYKILYVFGPTATGKTALALELAKQFNGDLISADSRQVYAGMDIGTGKDIPETFHKETRHIGNQDISVYTDGQISIWGLDIVTPAEEFSVTSYIRFAIPVIESIWKRGRLPIVVGGTGLYVRALRRQLLDISVPRNDAMRIKSAGASVVELQEMLKQIDEDAFIQMNHSDQANPRRLVRMIERCLWKQSHPSIDPFIETYQQFVAKQTALLIGLQIDFPVLTQRIRKRVHERVQAGLLKEIETLHAHGYSWQSQALSGLGYRQWQPYFEHKISQTEVIQKWEKDEIDYAKRQLTWFAKEPEIQWFTLDKQSRNRQIFQLVKTWYTENTLKYAAKI
jgi:tRNA dimethylallyltransferase